MSDYNITKRPFIQKAKTGEYANPYLIGNTANSTSSGSGSTSASGTLTVKDLLATDSPDTYKVLIQKTDGTFYSHPNLKAVHNEANKVSLYADAFLGGFTQAKDVLLTDQKQSGGDTEYNILFAQPVSTNGIYTIYYTANLNGEQNKLTYNSREGIMSAKNFAGDGSRLTNLTWDNITGKPTIPLNAVLATETYVNTQIAAIVNSAPSTLDTLNELATALGNDPNFATTVTNLIATKAPLANPVFTGIPKVGTDIIWHAGNLNRSDVDFIGNNIVAQTVFKVAYDGTKSKPCYVLDKNGAGLFGIGNLQITDGAPSTGQTIKYGRTDNGTTWATSDNDYRHYFDGKLYANGGANQVWDAGTLNRSDVDFTAKNINAANAYLSGVFKTTRRGQPAFVGNLGQTAYWGIGEDAASGTDWVKLCGVSGNDYNGVSANFFVTGNIKVGTSIFSKDYSGSGFTATGWQIGDYSNLNNLDVRGRLQTYEFVQNKISIANGNMIVSDNAKCSTTYRWNNAGEATGINRRWIFTEPHPFNQGDILRCKSNGKDYQFQVGWIDSARTIVDAYYCDNSLGDIPSNGDLLVRWNSTDASRKGLLYLNSSDTNAPNFQVLYDGQVKGCFGNCAGLNWLGSTLPSNSFGTWIDNGWFNGGINAGSGKIAGWNIDNYQIYKGTNGVGLEPMIRLSTQNTGSGDIYYGRTILEGLSLTWHRYNNAGHLVFGQIAANGSTIKTGYKGIQMMSWTGDEYFALAANSNVEYKDPYCRIAGWGFDNWHLWNNNIELRNDGIIRHTGDKWRFNNDGSWQLAGSNLYGDANGNIIGNNCTFNNGKFNGAINTNTGSIGGFNIYDTYMRSEDANWGWFTLDTRRGVYWHGYNNQLGKHFEIGGGTPPISYRDDGATGYFQSSSTTSGLSSRTAIYAIAENGTYNTAIQAKGNIVTNGALYATGVNYYVASISTLNTSCKNGDTLLVYCTYSGSNVYMPTISDIRTVLGVSSTDNFRVRITINNKYNSPYGFYLYPGSDWGSYFRDWNGSNISNYLLNKGDSLMFDCYYYDGSAWIQTINNQT